VHTSRILLFWDDYSLGRKVCIIRRFRLAFEAWAIAIETSAIFIIMMADVNLQFEETKHSDLLKVYFVSLYSLGMVQSFGPDR
jgi:hypothetical protein